MAVPTPELFADYDLRPAILSPLNVKSASTANVEAIGNVKGKPAC